MKPRSPVARVFLALLAAAVSGSAQPIDWEELNDPERQHREPFKVFDNLYYIGIDFASAWLLTTDDGLIVLDSLWGDFADRLLENVETLGFDPAEIRYVLISHGHFDHSGGARRIQEATGARVGMTAADWNLVHREPGEGRARYEPPERDLVIEDGDVISLGDTKVLCRVTPGHTEGVLTLEFDVRDGEETHRALSFGGIGRNFSGVERAETYLASVRRLMQVEDLEVNVPNHPSMGRVFQRAALLAERRAGEPHPFVSGNDLRKWLAQLESGGLEKLEEEREGGS